MKNEIFDRTTSEAKIISSNQYNLIIGLTLCWGFFINWFMLKTISPEQILSVGVWVLLLGYFASCFFGIYLFNNSSKPIISFLGYNLVVIPFGLIINIFTSRYSPDLIVNAVGITGIITLTMMFLGTIYPAFFQKIHRGLIFSLMACILIELFATFFLQTNFEFIDWIVILIFCGYVGYDWGRANQIPKTCDNAIDSAAALYMDIINLFLRILKIMGKKK